MDEKPLAAPGRHDMAFITAEALSFAQRSAVRLDPGLTAEQAAEYLRADIPAIVTRQTRRRPNGVWDAGFSLPVQERGSRLRLRSMIPIDGIVRLVTPYDVAGADIFRVGEKPHAVLTGLRDLGARCGISVGVYGSLALEALTGLPYLTPSSDYDIYLRADAPRPDLSEFYHCAQALGSARGVHIDMEIACLEDSGVKLAELFSGQKTVLCKGLYGVKICPLEELGLLQQ